MTIVEGLFLAVHKLYLKKEKRFGAPMHMGRYGWRRVGPTCAPASESILRATPDPPVVHFFWVLQRWAHQSMPKWFHQCSVHVIVYDIEQPIEAHQHLHDASPLSVVVEMGEFTGGGVCAVLGGVLWLAKKQVPHEEDALCKGKRMIGTIHSAREGLMLKSQA